MKVKTFVDKQYQFVDYMFDLGFPTDKARKVLERLDKLDPNIDILHKDDTFGLVRKFTTATWLWLDYINTVIAYCRARHPHDVERLLEIKRQCRLCDEQVGRLYRTYYRQAGFI
jgi:hypothetical protein